MAKRIKLACPICRKPVTSEEPQFPFCSQRCRTLDLGDWADGAYVVSTPLTAADLLGDADYTMGPVERTPASAVKDERQMPRPGEDEGKPSPHLRPGERRIGARRGPLPKAGRCGAPRKEAHGRKRG